MPFCRGGSTGRCAVSAHCSCSGTDPSYKAAISGRTCDRTSSTRAFGSGASHSGADAARLGQRVPADRRSTTDQAQDRRVPRVHRACDGPLSDRCHSRSPASWSRPAGRRPRSASRPRRSRRRRAARSTTSGLEPLISSAIVAPDVRRSRVTAVRRRRDSDRGDRVMEGRRRSGTGRGQRAGTTTRRRTRRERGRPPRRPTRTTRPSPVHEVDGSTVSSSSSWGHGSTR